MLDKNRIIDEARALPSPPLVLNKLLQLLSNRTASAEAVNKLVVTDSALSFSALRLVNSAMYRRRSGATTTVKRALVMLGNEGVMELVAGQLANHFGAAPLAGYGCRADALWRHALHTALIARELAKHVSTVDSAVAYSACLLIDIGKLGLARHLGEAPLLEVGWDTEAGGSDELERRLLGIDHAELGALMAASWGIPDVFVELISHHHRPASAPHHQALAYIAHLADVVASAPVELTTPVEPCCPFAPGWRHVLGIDHTTIQDAADAVRERAAALEEALRGAA